MAINILYRRTCAGRVFATCSHIRSFGGTTPIGGAIKPSIDGLKGELAYGHGQRSILLFFFLYKEISRRIKCDQVCEDKLLVIVVDNLDII